MSFADLFARYREMGAMGPQPCDEHTLLFDDAGSTWTQLINGDSKVRPGSDEEYEELFSSSHGLGLNLGFLKKNNVCKDYYTLTSNVLRSLIMGIKEMTTEKITPAWQVGFPCGSPKKSLSSLFANKLNEEAIYPKLAPTHSSGDIGTSKLSPLSQAAKLSMREAVDTASLRRSLWGQIGLPVSYSASTSPVNDNSTADAVVETPRSLDSQEQATPEAQLVDGEAQSRQILCEGLEQARSSSAEDRLLEEDNPVESDDIGPNMSETKDTKANDEMTVRGNIRTPPRSTAEVDEAPVKHPTDSESDHELSVRRPRPTSQTASGNKQSTTSRRSKEDNRNSRKSHDGNWATVPSRNCSLPVSSIPAEGQRQVSSSRPRQTVLRGNNEAIMPPRPRSWCLVGGYVKRFPTKHHHASPKIQHPTKSPPQVPLAA